MVKESWEVFTTDDDWKECYLDEDEAYTDAQKVGGKVMLWYYFENPVEYPCSCDGHFEGFLIKVDGEIYGKDEIKEMIGMNYIEKWTKKVIALDEAMKLEVPIKDSEELMIQLLTELLAETSISDGEYEQWKNHFRFYGLKESDVEDVLKRVEEVEE